MNERWKGLSVLGLLASLSACSASSGPSQEATPSPSPAPAAPSASAVSSGPARPPPPPPSASSPALTPVPIDRLLAQDDAKNDRRVGTIQFSPTGMPDGSFAPIASFFEELGIPPTCEQKPIGVCSLETCGKAPPRHTGTVRRPSAGVLDVKFADKLEHLTPTTAGDMFSYLGGDIEAPPAGGELFEVHANGDRTGVPSFTGAVHVPKGVRLLAPVVGKSPKPFLIQQGKPLSYAWTPGTTGQFKVSLTELPPGNRKLTCSFPASARSGVIPADALAELQPGRLLHAYGVSDTVVVHADKYTITIAAEAPRLASAKDESTFARLKAQ